LTGLLHGLIIPRFKKRIFILKNRKTLKSDSKVDPHQLFEAFLTLKTAEEVACFLNDLCTPAELQAIVDRWRVVEPIKNGIPYRTIYEQTGVSVTTVGRVARCLHEGSGGYDLAWDRLHKETKGKKG
jgi:TrpR-related protein YerC/YecD